MKAGKEAETEANNTDPWEQLEKEKAEFEETKKPEKDPLKNDELKKGIKSYLQNLFNIRDDMMPQADIDAMMQENTVIHGSNMWILILAMLIASIGLYNNSTVTIIGAMLISPLMNGILTMGYSLAVRDLPMLGKAFKRFSTQVVISLVASTIFFSIARLDEPTAEMVARTSPTFWDVLIALFGGVAGIIGNTRTKKGNVIPGVAIATALMPPLCTAGYGLATFQPKFFFGALYLFLINTLLIALSACIITNVLKIPNRVQLDKKKSKKINVAVTAIVIIVVVPSVLTGAFTIYGAHIDSRIDNYLENEFTLDGAQLVQSNVDKEKKEISVALVGRTVSESEIYALTEQLQIYGLEDYTLVVAQNTALDGAGNSDKITIAIQENKIEELQQQLAENQAKLDALENSLAAQVDFNAVADSANNIFGNLINKAHCGMMSDAGKEYFVMMAHYNEDHGPLTEDETKMIEEWLKDESGSELVLLYTYE